MALRRGYRLFTVLILLCLFAPSIPDFPASPGPVAAQSETTIPAQDATQRQVIIFVPGINTAYDPASSTPQAQDLAHFFELKQVLLRDHGYQTSDFVDFSYAPNAYVPEGGTDLVTYSCLDTGKDPFVSGQSLRQLIQNVHDSRSGDKIVLVGHSLGGVIITWALDGLNDASVTSAIAGIVTIGSPLFGARSDDIQWIYAEGARRTQCNGTGLLTDSFAATQLNTELTDHQYQESQGRSGIAEQRLTNTLDLFHDRGVRIGTFGNLYDCIYNHIACGTLLTSILPGSGGLGSIDISWTQVYPSPESPMGFSKMYALDSWWQGCITVDVCVPASHEYLLKHPQPEMLQAIGSAVVEVPPGSVALPESWLGEWTGEGTQTNPALTWPITITFTGGVKGEVVGTVDYPPNTCTGELTYLGFDAPDAQGLQFREAITSGEENCLAGGTFTMTSSDPDLNELHFWWSHPTDDTEARGVLYPASAIVPVDKPIDTSHDPSQTSYVEIRAIACAELTEVSYAFTPGNWGTPNPECTLFPHVAISITDPDGAVTDYDMPGYMTLDLPAGSYTITERDSGVSATFALPQRGDFAELQSLDCASRASCVNITIWLPEASGSQSPSGSPATTAHVSIGAMTCSSSTTVNFNVVDLSSGGPYDFFGCGGTGFPTSFTITGASGTSTIHDEGGNSGPTELSLPLGTYTITENASGQSYTFNVPPLNQDPTVPEDCVGRTGCVLVVVTYPPSMDGSETVIEPTGGDPGSAVTGSSVRAPYLGTWKGIGTQVNPSVEWPVSITLNGGDMGSTVGAMDYPTYGCGGDLVLREVTADTIVLIEDLTYGEDSCTDGGTITLGLLADGTMSFAWVGTRSDDSASSATGTLYKATSGEGSGGSTQITSISPDPSDEARVDTSELHLFFIGTWAGTGTQTNPTAAWPVTITLGGGQPGEVIGTIDYPTLGCGGDLVLDSIDPLDPFLTVEVAEYITYGQDNCIDGGTFSFSGAEGGRRLIFQWISPDGTTTAEGYLDPL